MDYTDLPPGTIRVLVEVPAIDDDLGQALQKAAKAVVEGHDPGEDFVSYFAKSPLSSFVTIDRSFIPVPIGHGVSSDNILLADLVPSTRKFLMRGFVQGGAGFPVRVEHIKSNGGAVHSDPPIAGLLTCGNSRAVGDTAKVQYNLDVNTLTNNGCDGTGVAIAIVDTGINLRRLAQPLGSRISGPSPRNDAANSWKPRTIATQPFQHRVGHGTQSAYDALIAAPNATLLDIAMLLARAPGDHAVPGTVSGAINAYWKLQLLWDCWTKSVAKPYHALVISNSWGILHPSLDPFPPGSYERFIDNPNHAFRKYFIRPLVEAGVDIVFSSSNCGRCCAAASCLGQTSGMIMGANAYEEVLTVGGCDNNNDRVGYSAQGPSIAGMFQNKPDITAYTHFLGSKTVDTWIPDTGVSAACAVAAGCVAALRTKLPPTAKSPTELFDALKATATAGNSRPGSGGTWNKDYGFGIIDPVAAGRKLGLQFPNA